MFALRLPVPKTFGIADEQLKDVMLGIVNSPRMQKRLGAFRALHKEEEERGDEEDHPDDV
jgi:hypothetical protein